MVSHLKSCAFGGTELLPSRFVSDIAESHADADVDEKNTVLAVPLDFTADQRSAVAACAKEAGFHVVQVMSEPAASCLTYSLGQLDPASECYTCLVSLISE